jgi:hypothetical protein
VVLDRRAREREAPPGAQHARRLGHARVGVLDRLRLVEDRVLELPARQLVGVEPEDRIRGHHQIGRPGGRAPRRPIRAGVVHDAQPGHEPARLVEPVEHHRLGRDHQRGPVGSPGREHGQHLHGLAEAHVVGEASAEADLVEKPEPAQPIALVRPQLAAEAARLAARFDRGRGGEPGAQLAKRRVDLDVGQRGQHRVEERHRRARHPQRAIAEPAQRREPAMLRDPLGEHHARAPVGEAHERLPLAQRTQELGDLRAEPFDVRLHRHVEPVDVALDPHLQPAAAAKAAPTEPQLPAQVLQLRHRLDKANGVDRDRVPGVGRLRDPPVLAVGEPGPRGGFGDERARDDLAGAGIDHERSAGGGHLDLAVAKCHPAAEPRGPGDRLDVESRHGRTLHRGPAQLVEHQLRGPRRTADHLHQRGQLARGQPQRLAPGRGEPAREIVAAVDADQAIVGDQVARARERGDLIRGQRLAVARQLELQRDPARGTPGAESRGERRITVPSQRRQRTSRGGGRWLVRRREHPPDQPPARAQRRQHARRGARMDRRPGEITMVLDAHVRPGRPELIEPVVHGNDRRRAAQEQLDQRMVGRAHVPISAELEPPRCERAVALSRAATDRDPQLGRDRGCVAPGELLEENLDLGRRDECRRPGGCAPDPAQPAAPTGVGDARPALCARAPRGNDLRGHERPRGRAAMVALVAIIVEVRVVVLVAVEVVVVEVIAAVKAAEPAVLILVLALLGLAGPDGLARRLVAQTQRPLRLAGILDLEHEHVPLGAQIHLLLIQPQDDGIDVLARDPIRAHRTRARHAQPPRRRDRTRHRDQIGRRSCPTHARLRGAAMNLEIEDVATARVRCSARSRGMVERRGDPGQERQRHGAACSTAL